MVTTTLFKRNWKFRLDRYVYDSRETDTPIQIAFEVTKTLYSFASIGKLTASNLNAEHRAELARLRHNRRRIRVEIHAGYGEDTSLLFIGDVRGFTDEPNGTEALTTVEGSDGGPLITERRIARTYAAGTLVTTPVFDMVDALGIGEGNSRELLGATLRGYPTLPRPKTFTHLVSQELTGYLRSMGYTWSIQNGAVQILRHGATLARTGVRLTPETGLISAHYVDRWTIKVVSFLIPEVCPGYRIIIESERVTGDFRVHEVKYSGDSFGGDWICEITCRVPRPLLPY